MEQFYTRLTVLILSILDRRKMSQTALAKEIGCSPPLFNKYMRFKARIPSHKMVKVCKVLGIELKEL